VIKRIPPRTPAGGPFQGGFVISAPSRVWAIGNGAIGIDPATNRVVSEIRLGGSITRFDATSGRRIGPTSSPAKASCSPTPTS
jgi:hypothetical protein